MQYLCLKQLTAGGKTYYRGDVIPDGVIFPERGRKLERNKYISNFADNMVGTEVTEGNVYTQEEFDTLIAQAASELKQTESDAYRDVVVISVKGKDSDGSEQITAVPAMPEEIQDVFSIMQMNAEDGAKEIEKIASENVLILLHAVDSRKTIKNATRERADILFSTQEKTNTPKGGNGIPNTNVEGVGT